MKTVYYVKVMKVMFIAVLIVPKYKRGIKNNLYEINS